MALIKNIDTEKIKQDFLNGLSNSDISKKYNISAASVSYWRRKFNLPNLAKKYNWTEIQEAHNKGASYKQLREMFGVTKRSIQMAKERGVFETVIRDIPRKTEEEKRAVRREAWQRYDARKRYQTPADEDISALQEFYKNCPEGYEVDHIIPLSKGGAHSLSNLQYLTITENRRKGNRIP
jgi:5-methylcytosine-specific restriction endonuclease McrA